MNTSLADSFARRYALWRIALVVSLVACAAGSLYVTRAGLYFLDIIDHFVTNVSLVLVGLLQAILVGWVYGADKVRTYINEVSTMHLGPWWNVAIRYVIPLILAVLLGHQIIADIRTPYEGYPGWALGIGWAAATMPVLIFAWMFFNPKRNTVQHEE